METVNSMLLCNKEPVLQNNYCNIMNQYYSHKNANEITMLKYFYVKIVGVDYFPYK